MAADICRAFDGATAGKPKAAFSDWQVVCVCVCVCVCVFIKLHITAQSGLVILVILCHSRARVCVCVCVFIKLHITAQSGPVILVVLCHSH